jgi:superoxide dismutase, Fe-Mn family
VSFPQSLNQECLVEFEDPWKQVADLYDRQTAINEDFGSFDTLRKQANTALAGIQGSGWAWLVKDKTTGTLSLVTRANQDPITGNLAPLLGIDAWEHAYYLQYQNRKAEYFDAIWNVINWSTVAARFEKA